MSNALAKINKRVKQLAKKHPGAKRTTLQKQAGREYRAGKLGRVKKKSVKKVSRRRVSGVKKHKRVASVSRNVDKTDAKRVSINVGSVASHISAAKKALINEIGWNEAAKLTAKTAKSKREIQKRINMKKLQLRKLQ